MHMSQSFRQEFYTQNKNKICNLVEKFVGYHVNVTPKRIKNFLDQFEPEQMNLGLKVLDQVHYFSHECTIKQVKLLVRLLDDEVCLKRGNVYFCTMSMTSGQSTDSIMRTVRHVANMKSSKYNNRFLFLRDLEELQNDGDEKTIIFVDDFVGSGNTVCKLWSILSNWYNKNHQYYVGIIAGYKSAINVIEDDTRLTIISSKELEEHCKVFHETNIVFNADEKSALKKYCKIAAGRSNFTYGYKNTQSLVVFYENTPNNTIPILHQKNKNWRFPPFPRL